jgi:NADH-quinone oxidoreductase subunit M
MLYRAVPESARSFDFPRVAGCCSEYQPNAPGNIFLLFLIGFGILVSLFPFHSWAPEAYASAPAPAAMLHAGVLKKFGLYGLLRLGASAPSPRRAGMEHSFDCPSSRNIIYVGLVTIAQKQLDWMLVIQASCTWAIFSWALRVGRSSAQAALQCLFLRTEISIALLSALPEKSDNAPGHWS